MRSPVQSLLVGLLSRRREDRTTEGRLLRKTRMQARLLEQRDDDRTALAKAREAAAAPSKWGHSDLGDGLVSYLKGEWSLDYFLWFCDVTYLGSTRSCPCREKEEDADGNA